MLGLSPPSSLLSFHHLLCAVNISKPRIQDPWFPQALLQYAIRLAVLSLDQYGVSVSPKPIMRKLRLNLKLSMTGRISVQPKMSLTSKMSVGFEPEGGLEVGFLWWPTFLLNRLQCRDLGHGRCLIMLLPPEMELAYKEHSVSTNLPGLQEEKQLVCFQFVWVSCNKKL